jgi:hypothetical protein
LDAGQIIFLLGSILGGSLIGVWLFERLKLRRTAKDDRRY